MSYDFDVQQAACDHAQTRERYIIDSNDFRTLHLASNTTINMRAPVTNKSSLELYISGVLVSPTDPTYGYTIVPDPNRLESDNSFYKIVFNKQVRLIIPLIEVTYFTNVSFCIKCNGISQLNDLKIAASGAFLHVFGTNKMVQKSLKFILTSVCPFYPQFTCPIKSYIGQKFGVQVTDTDIANAIMAALQSMKNVQSAQITVQPLDPLERLKDITNVTAVIDSVDPTQVNVTCQVSSYGTNTTQPLGFSLTTTKTQYYSPGGN